MTRYCCKRSGFRAVDAGVKCDTDVANNAYDECDANVANNAGVVQTTRM